MMKTFPLARPTAMLRASLLEHKRASRLMRTTWAVLCMGLAMSTTNAQTPGKVDAEVVELAAQLLGAPVLVESKEVGKLADISTGDDGRIDRIRISTAAKLGLGVRIVEIRAGSYRILRGAVVLDLPADALDNLPTAVTQEDAREDE